MFTDLKSNVLSDGNAGLTPQKTTPESCCYSEWQFHTDIADLLLLLRASLSAPRAKNNLHGKTGIRVYFQGSVARTCNSQSEVHQGRQVTHSTHNVHPTGEHECQVIVVAAMKTLPRIIIIQVINNESTCYSKTFMIIIDSNTNKM